MIVPVSESGKYAHAFAHVEHRHRMSFGRARKGDCATAMFHAGTKAARFVYEAAVVPAAQDLSRLAALIGRRRRGLDQDGRRPADFHTVATQYYTRVCLCGAQAGEERNRY